MFTVDQARKISAEVSRKREEAKTTIKEEYLQKGRESVEEGGKLYEAVVKEVTREAREGNNNACIPIIQKELIPTTFEWVHTDREMDELLTGVLTSLRWKYFLEGAEQSIGKSFEGFDIAIQYHPRRSRDDSRMIYVSWDKIE